MNSDFLNPRTIKTSCWIVLAVLTIFGWVWFGRELATGILVGGLLAVLILWPMSSVQLSTGDGLIKRMANCRAPGGFFHDLKVPRLRFTILAVIIFFLVKDGWVNIFGLVVGLSTVVLTLIVLGILEFRKAFFFVGFRKIFFKEA